MKLDSLFEEKMLSYFDVQQRLKPVFDLMNLQPAILTGDGENPTRIIRQFFLVSEDWEVEQGLDYAMPFENRCQAFLKKLAVVLREYAEQGYVIGFTPVETDGVPSDKIYSELVKHVQYKQYYSDGTMAKLGAPKEMPKVYFNISRVKKPSKQGTGD